MAEDEAAADEGEPDVAAEDTASEEPDAAAEDGADAEGTEEPMEVGKLVGLSAKGGMIDTGREVIILPSATAEGIQDMAEFSYEPGMKTVSHPDGYPAE